MIDYSKLYPMITSQIFYPEYEAGWNCLVDDFFEEMNSAASAFKAKSVTVTQIKSKFGAMRIYVEYNLPDEQIIDLEKIVSKYESLSKKTCSMCGDMESPIHNRKGYWEMVLCEKCYGEHNGK